jgi:hypothetical protein
MAGQAGDEASDGIANACLDFAHRSIFARPSQSRLRDDESHLFDKLRLSAEDRDGGRPLGGRRSVPLCEIEQLEAAGARRLTT